MNSATARLHVLSSLVLALAAANVAPAQAVPGSAAAEPEAADAGTPSTRLHVRFDGGAWFVRLRGDSSLSGASPAPAVEDIGLGGSEVAPFLSLAVGDDDFTIRASGFTFSTDGTAVVDRGYAFGPIVVGPGDEVRSSFDIDSAGVELALALYRPFAARTFPWSDPVGTDAEGGSLVVSPIIGGRWLRLEQRFESGGAAEEVDGDWFALLFGAEVAIEVNIPDSFPVIDRLEIVGAGSFGPAFGSETGYVFDIRALIGIWFTPNVALSIGYRYLGADVEQGDWSFDGNLAGLYAGGSIRF